MTEKPPTWMEYTDEGLEDAQKDAHQTELLTDNSKQNPYAATAHISWVYNADEHIVRLYRTVKHLQEYVNSVNDLLQQLLDADRSVPKEEIQARAELLGLFVHALRERTQGALP